MGKRRAKKKQSPNTPPAMPGVSSKEECGGMSAMEQAVRSKIAELELSSLAAPDLSLSVAGDDGGAGDGLDLLGQNQPDHSAALNAANSALEDLDAGSTAVEPNKTEEDETYTNALLAKFDGEILDESRSIEERIQVVRDLYAEQERGRLAAQRAAEALRARVAALEPAAREKGAALRAEQAALARAGGQADGLRRLCRGLRDRNQVLLDERQRVAAEEAGRRADLSARFGEVIQGVQADIEAQDAARRGQLDENRALRDRLQDYLRGHEAREAEHLAQLEAAAAAAAALEAERAARAQEAAGAARRAAGYQEAIGEVAQKEAGLRGQLAAYADKFERFQDALNRSNDMFSEFKSKMEAMTKTIQRLEEENTALRSKEEKSAEALREMEEEAARNARSEELLRAQKGRLEGLCRTMQEERAVRQQRIDELRARAEELRQAAAAGPTGNPNGAAGDHRTSSTSRAKVASDYYEDFAKMARIEGMG